MSSSVGLQQPHSPPGHLLPDEGGALSEGLQVCRDTCIQEDETATPFLELQRAQKSHLEAGEFVPVTSADLVSCLRRMISGGFVFAPQGEVAGNLGASALGPKAHSQSPRGPSPVSSPVAAADSSSGGGGGLRAPHPLPPPPPAVITAAGTFAPRGSFGSTSGANHGHRMRSPGLQAQSSGSAQQLGAAAASLAGVSSGGAVASTASPTQLHSRSPQLSPNLGHRSPRPTSPPGSGGLPLVLPCIAALPGSWVPTSGREPEAPRPAASSMAAAAAASSQGGSPPPWRSSSPPSRPVGTATRMTSPGGKTSPRGVARGGPRNSGASNVRKPPPQACNTAAGGAATGSASVSTAAMTGASSPPRPPLRASFHGQASMTAVTSTSAAASRGSMREPAPTLPDSRCRSPAPAQPGEPTGSTMSPRRRHSAAHCANGLLATAAAAVASRDLHTTSASACTTTAGSTASARGRSPKASRSPEALQSPRSPRSSRSPSPSGAAGGRHSHGTCSWRTGGMAYRHRFHRGGSPMRGKGSPPRASSPFNVHTDHDVILELPADNEWHRFEALVGIADWAANSWPAGSVARFLVIDDDTQTVLWESAEHIEPWAPPELCSLCLASDDVLPPPQGLGLGGCSVDLPAFQPRRLCLRVQCAAPPEGALWIEPTVTSLRRPGQGCGERHVFGSVTVRSEEDSRLPSTELHDEAGAAVVASTGQAAQSRRRMCWEDLLMGELHAEIVARLHCRDVVRLLGTKCLDAHVQQSMWHFAFASSFRAAYLRHFLRPLQGQSRPPSLGHLQQHSRPVSHHSLRSAVAPASPRLDASIARLPRRSLTGGSPLRPAASLSPRTSTATAGYIVSSGTRPKASQTAAMPGGNCLNFVPHWALEAFDWRQVVKRFYVAQLLCLNVNFQMFNVMTPSGFVKDSGETFHAPRGCPASPLGLPLRFGWNVQLGNDHFQSRPSAVVAHRSPLGVAGLPPGVAAVRGTAGPEPLAMTPMASEKDSSVILPVLPSMPAGAAAVRPQWTLEVDPGHYIVLVTVGDRNVGFSAQLEVNGHAVFNGEWIEAGCFKSRCVLCLASRGAITVGPHWLKSNCGCMPGSSTRCQACLELACSETVERGSPPNSPRAACGVAGGSSSGIGGPAAGSGHAIGQQSPRSQRHEAMARGTRLVSLRVAAVALMREVERERWPMVADINQKLNEVRGRLDALKRARSGEGVLEAAVAAVPAAVDHGDVMRIERDIMRVHAKLAELQVQKAQKLFSLISMCRRVTHPYVYLSGESSALPPVGQVEPER
eukprot:TRINITY_DN35572_c0_g1_i2.p1 TRINITY_DN35572_c0_g1~~TRINITY_DN35572_c0_g1_i2.p1  ORF type:complete len:1284 (-),score=185.39 TRINITY_DN35572_c0_g1_i2:41-3892(-)